MHRLFSLEHTTWTVARNYDKHMELLHKAGKSQGCVCEPALPFDAQQSPPDMLHLKKGIISKLLNQIVNWTLLQHREDYLLSEMKKHKIPFM